MAHRPIDMENSPWTMIRAPWSGLQGVPLPWSNFGPAKAWVEFPNGFWVCQHVSEESPSNSRSGPWIGNLSNRPILGKSFEKDKEEQEKTAILPRQIIPEFPYNMHKVHLQQTTESILEENQPSTSNKLTSQFRQTIILNHPISKTYPARKTKAPMNIHTKIWPSAMANAMANRTIFFCTQLTTLGRARNIFRQFLAFVLRQYSV